MARIGDTKAANYEDRFIDVMYYAKEKLENQGKFYQIKNKEDIEELLLWIDKKRKYEGEGHISDSFINEIARTDHAKDVFDKKEIRISSPDMVKKHGRIVLFEKGGFIGAATRLVQNFLSLRESQTDHKTFVIEQRTPKEQEKIKKFREEGTTVYKLRTGGFGYFIVIKEKKGKPLETPQKQLRSLTTGRITKVSFIEREIDR